MPKETYWTVTLEAFAFPDKESAVKFRDLLNDAFCSMPEADGYGCVTRVVEEEV